MLFNSFPFVVLLLITFGVYYIPAISKKQTFILILSSLVFYSWNDLPLVLLLISSAGVNIITSYLIGRKKTNHIKFTALVGVFSNLFILAFFKYAGLISITLFKSNNVSEFLIKIPLPIGISFFTFQGISLVIDVYKENYFSNDKIISQSFYQHSKNTLFFIAFFPQLVAGPIVKAHEFLPQVEVKKFSEIAWEKCFQEVVLGYFLKLVVADNLKDFTFGISFPYFQNNDTSSLLAMLFGFSFQIFADFAGYSLIAIGIARLFGYNLNKNFNFPYISKSFKEFWKRWHISLSSFLQEYLYIPIGGSRKGKVRTYFNLIITMVLGGLWHGAAWSYAVWGGFHGIALAIERFFGKRIENDEGVTTKSLRILFVFIMVSLSWLLFKLPEFDHVIQYLDCIIKNTNYGLNLGLIVSIFVFSTPVILYHIFYLYLVKFNNSNIQKYKYIFYGIMLFLIFTNSGIPGSFIYFQF
ncbi:MAG: MBOAT family protein [Candidatus Delongbacteria bacterium]|nr:MBOAT family protein [Candidatus Delongbacteria bacterium]MBN2836862.1 MBOAT family protein [Candidatus Delongbacteria bacterium]